LAPSAPGTSSGARPLQSFVEAALPEEWSGISAWEALGHVWALTGRPNQLPPSGDWLVWVIQAGRAWGKSAAGAHFAVSAAEHAGRLVVAGALSREAAKVIVVAPTAADLRDVCVEGDSGLLRASPPWMEATFEPSKRRLTWSNGAEAILISADEADRVRGVQGVAAWLDEIAIYPKLDEVFANVRLAVRLGDRPRICATTTPRNRRELRAILEAKGTIVTRGHTRENTANLAPGIVAALEAEFGHSHRGRQELAGELIGSSEFALWNVEEIDSHRVARAPEDLKRVAVAVDPSGTSHAGSDECGIVVAATAECSCRGATELHGFVLEDCSLRAAPEVWARQAVTAYERHRADVICAETNFGADLVEATIRTVSANVSFKKLTASRGKERRAEPIASLSAQGKIHFVGSSPQLEDQLTTWSPLYDKWSPDRLDAFVWAFTELDLGRPPYPSIFDVA
jgi:phage terminase large subunit-like protein